MSVIQTISKYSVYFLLTSVVLHMVANIVEDFMENESTEHKFIKVIRNIMFSAVLAIIGLSCARNLDKYALDSDLSAVNNEVEKLALANP